MEKKSKEFESKLFDKEKWKKQIGEDIASHFTLLGIDCPDVFMRIRFYDFLNLNMVDYGCAKRTIVCLFRYLFPTRAKCAAFLNNGMTSSIVKWLSEYSEPEKTTISDLLCDERLSEKEMLYVFDCLSQSFYHSEEYNYSHYLFENICELDYLNENKDY